MTALQDLAQEIQVNLKTVPLDSGGTLIAWHDKAPAELKLWWQGVTGQYNDYSFADLDEYYTVLSDLCDLIVDEVDESVEDVDDVIYSHDWATIYNSELLDWVSANTSRAGDVDQAIAEGADTLFGAITEAMQATRSAMACSFANSLMERAAAKV